METQDCANETLLSTYVRANETLLSTDVGPNETLLSTDLGPNGTLLSMDVGPNETLLSTDSGPNETLLSTDVGPNKTLLSMRPRRRARAPRVGAPARRALCGNSPTESASALPQRAEQPKRLPSALPAMGAVLAMGALLVLELAPRARCAAADPKKVPERRTPPALPERGSADDPLITAGAPGGEHRWRGSYVPCSALRPTAPSKAGGG